MKNSIHTALRKMDTIQEALKSLAVPGPAEGSVCAAIRAVGRLEGVLYSLRGLPESLRPDLAHGCSGAGSLYPLSVPGEVGPGGQKKVPSRKPMTVTKAGKAKKEPACPAFSFSDFQHFPEP